MGQKEGIRCISKKTSKGVRPPDKVGLIRRARMTRYRGLFLMMVIGGLFASLVIMLNAFDGDQREDPGLEAVQAPALPMESPPSQLD